jgi:hypothetical protein
MAGEGQSDAASRNSNLVPFRCAAFNEMETSGVSLGPVLDRGGFATLALVSTGENLREWIYYAQSEGGFAARFDYAFAGRSAFPIEINSAHDPQWQTYEEFRAGVREGDGSSS